MIKCPVELKVSDEADIVRQYIKERVETLTNNLLTFGNNYDSVCFNQGKVAALREFLNWLDGKSSEDVFKMIDASEEGE